MNVYDSDKMLDILGENGYSAINNPDDADLVILNTCHIREKAGEKVYSDLGRIRKIKANKNLAGKEMFIGRYYFDKKKWIPAINRFRIVVDNYETTIYVEEAIHRLVEIYYILGIETEAKKYANLLGYNYQSSQWYEKSFIVFNKNYKIKNIKKEDNPILEKFKSLFN